MDAELPGLEPDAEPADCSVWGTAYAVPVKRPGWQYLEAPAIPALFQNPRKWQYDTRPCLPYKKSEKTYSIHQTDYNIDRGNNSVA